MRGAVVAVESSALNRVDSFTLRAEDGRELRFRVGADALRAGHAPTPGHLREHMAHGDPMTVRYRTEGNELVALEVRDE